MCVCVCVLQHAGVDSHVPHIQWIEYSPFANSCLPITYFYRINELNVTDTVTGFLF